MICCRKYFILFAQLFGALFKKKSNRPMFRVLIISFFIFAFFSARAVGEKRVTWGFPILLCVMGERYQSNPTTSLSLSLFSHILLHNFTLIVSRAHLYTYTHILEKKRDRTTWHHHRYLSRARSLPLQSNNNKNNNFVNLPFPPRPRRSPSRLQPRSRFTSSTAKSETTFPALRCSSTKQTRRTRVSLLLP